MFKLVIQDDEGKTTIVPLIRDEITIGRKEGNTIRLTERNVSRRHARILRNNGEVHIEDLGSYNGIRVNNARIAERVSLRVSDQVQIGDYKLYLKAEGLDQVDESRTVPHERVEGAGATADAMVVATPNGTGPQVIPVPTAPPMVGNPNRTMVAIADTDPGRAVGPATAAAVAAMNAPGGYGRLVVLSSNFAGKEFELSRPQMIIGRTEENDIVINHRSISRNHAKLVREPENGRYTISDLQSSNGVRVNGSDYGKVELRRADVIDLGHVRLRFVEAGEDFVFSRDAVITDVPEVGGRRGVLIAVLAAIVVLVAGVVVYTMHAPGAGGGGGSDKRTATPGTAPSGAVVPDGGDEAVANGSGETPAPAGSATTVAAADGSAAGSAEDQAQPAAVVPPAAGSAAPGAKGDVKAKAAQCADLEVRKDWQQLLDCSTELANLGARDKASEFHEKARKEVVNSVSEGKVRAALRDGNLREAQKLLKTIGSESVYWANLNDQFKAIENPVIEETRRKALGMASAHECTGLKRLQTQLASSSSTNVAAAANVKCIDKNATASGDPGTGTKPAGGSGSDGGAGTTQAAPKSGGCDTVNVDEAMDQASKQFSAGFAKAALQVVSKALACRQDVRMYRMAAMYACAAHDLATAKAYFGRVPGNLQSGIEQKCQQEGLNIRAP